MRTITYNAGAYLVAELLRAGVVARFLEDGGDILLFETWGGQRVSVHLIESSIELYEIRSILNGNEAQGIHTLFILWCDRLLPGDGQSHWCPDWMEALWSLYDDRIYAYDIYGSEIFVFPVYFRGHGRWRESHYGTTVRISGLACGSAKVGIHTLRGAWRVAHFGGGAHARRPDTPAPDHKREKLRRYFDVLGADMDDDQAEIRKAYRLLARRYHPDLNHSPDATARMQRINEAYDQLMTLFEDE